MSTLVPQPRMPASPDLSWATGPLHPRLAEGALHVWRADLTTVSDEVAKLLCDEERRRAERVLGKRERQQWTRSRGVLRALLGRYLQIHPSTVRLVTGPHGKPALSDEAASPTTVPKSTSARASRLSFNLAHSGQLALYVFTMTGAVGIDVEVPRRQIDEVPLAARAFGRDEARRLEDLDRASRRREFLHAWTRHEAELKRQGTGIGAGAGRDDGEPWVAELEVGPRAAGAVAVERQPRELRCWEFELSRGAG